MIIPMLFAVVYLLSCFGVATAAKHRKVGSQRAFHIAVLFTPLVALVLVLISTKKLETHLQFYRCKRCGYEYSEKYSACPACAKEGLHIFVNETIKTEAALR
jgi:hypothetical protein